MQVFSLVPYHKISRTTAQLQDLVSRQIFKKLQMTTKPQVALVGLARDRTVRWVTANKDRAPWRTENLGQCWIIVNCNIRTTMVDIQSSMLVSNRQDCLQQIYLSILIFSMMEPEEGDRLSKRSFKLAFRHRQTTLKHLSTHSQPKRCRITAWMLHQPTLRAKPAPSIHWLQALSHQ